MFSAVPAKNALDVRMAGATTHNIYHTCHRTRDSVIIVTTAAPDCTATHLQDMKGEIHAGFLHRVASTSVLRHRDGSAGKPPSRLLSARCLERAFPSRTSPDSCGIDRC